MNTTKTKDIPVFPLPNVVFFPKTFLPLHIFEARYRKMVEDALSGTNQICMVLLKDGWEKDYFGNPEVNPIGCVGEIQFSEKLEDGKYNLTLYGTSRVEILDFIQETPYRVARVKYLRDRNFDHETFNIHYESARFMNLTREYLKESGLKNLDEILQLQTLSFEAIVNQIASLIDLSTTEKQALLNLDSLALRFERLKKFMQEKLRIIKIARSVKFVPEDPRWN